MASANDKQKRIMCCCFKQRVQMILSIEKILLTKCFNYEKINFVCFACSCSFGT